MNVEGKETEIHLLGLTLVLELELYPAVTRSYCHPNCSLCLSPRDGMAFVSQGVSGSWGMLLGTRVQASPLFVWR